MPVPELLKLSLTDTVATLRARKASPVELMEACLDRVEETRETVNAVVATHPRDKLLAEARAAESRIANGDARPLEGIPFGVKDLEDTAGLPNTHGSLPFKDNVVDSDAIHVARLKEAGAIVLGKTNAPEFGYTAITKNLIYSSTHSPWNLLHTPGGSSGGSAAAIAGGILPLATASDGGGSIRIPASFSGCFGLKTSFGRVPIGPIQSWPYGDTGVYGPLTKTVEDAALVLDQFCGAHPGDPNSLPHPGYSYVDRLAEPLPSNLRIAFSPDLGYAAVQSDVASAVAEAAQVFESLGHSLEDLEGGPPQMGEAWLTLGGFWQAGALRDLLPEHEPEFGYAFLRQVKQGHEMTPELFGELAERRARLNDWTTALFNDYDLLITPTVPYDPPPARGPFPSEVEGRKAPPAGVAAFTIPFNFSWHPAATVRVGLSAAGLPMGMQIVGPRHRDDLVLQAALAFQRERPWHPNWPEV